MADAPPPPRESFSCTDVATHIISVMLQRDAITERFDEAKHHHLRVFPQGRWYQDGMPLNPSIALELPSLHVLTARKGSRFIWDYGDGGKTMFFRVLDPPSQTLKSLADEFYSFKHLNNELKYPGMLQIVEKCRDDMELMRKRYEVAPSLVPREDGSLWCEQILEPMALPQRKEDRKARARLEDFQQQAFAELELQTEPIPVPPKLLVRLLVQLARQDVRIRALEDAGTPQVVATVKALAEGQLDILKHLGLKVKEGKKPAAAPNGHLPKAAACAEKP